MATSESDSSIRRSGVISTVRLLAVAAAVAVCAGGATPSRASIVNFAAVVDGAQETPPNASVAMASGTFVMDTDANTLGVNVVISVPPPSGEVAAHIHGFSGPGVPAPIVFGLPLGSPKVAVWNFAEGDQANIINGLTYVNIHSNAFLGGEIRGQVLRVPSCGDGILDGGETCDDGNTANGDCCSSTCQLDVATTPCTASVCETGQCDGLGTCVFSIRTTCKSALKSLLLVKNDASDDTKDKLIWKWIKGAQTDVSEFGVPTGTTNYTLCVYAGTAAIIDADVASNVDSGSPLWTSTSTGFKYKDKPGSSDGVQKVILKAGAANKSKALLKGKGSGLPDPPAGPFTLPVTAQLINSDDVCFEGVFDTGDIIKNEAEQFKAKAQ